MPRNYKVQSSNIKSIEYSCESRQLVVEFAGGSRYCYDEVPAGIVTHVLFAGSISSSFDQLVKKGGFQYRKLEAPSEPRS